MINSYNREKAAVYGFDTLSKTCVVVKFPSTIYWFIAGYTKT